MAEKKLGHVQPLAWGFPLAPKAALAPTGRLGDPRAPGGGFDKSPLGGSMVETALTFEVLAARAEAQTSANVVPDTSPFIDLSPGGGVGDGGAAPGGGPSDGGTGGTGGGDGGTGGGDGGDGGGGGTGDGGGGSGDGSAE